MSLFTFRCTEYKALPIGCIMRQSHVDSCCLVPDCRHATVAGGNEMLTTSRIFSKFQEIEKAESLLKQMFNHRNKMRNKPSIQDNEKISSVEITNHFQNVPIVIKASDLDRRTLQHSVDQANNSRTYLQIYNKLSNSKLQNKDARTLHRNRTAHKQQIVTPYNLINSNREHNRASNTHARYHDPNKQKEASRNPSFRTIATQTGLYKVRKKDGVISSPRSQSLSNNVLNPLEGVSSTENKQHNSNTPGTSFDLLLHN